MGVPSNAGSNRPSCTSKLNAPVSKNKIHAGEYFLGTHERGLWPASLQCCSTLLLGEGEGGGGGGGTVCLFQLRPPIGNVSMIVLLFGFEDPLTERAS